ncbi:Endonuclease/exonuclease/phosphatase [Trinorchestia longiramus]|nr:Endonuclease/exonuclease/phosphatase [Trinorchestia longiramus]
MEDEQDGECKTTRISRKIKEKPVEESEIQEGGKKKMHTSADGAEEDSKGILVRPIGMEAHTFTSDPVALAQGIGESPFKVIQKSHIRVNKRGNLVAFELEEATIGKLASLLAVKRLGKWTVNCSQPVSQMQYAVFLFNAPPRRCYRCQRLGHVAVNCNSLLRCLVCSGPHTKDECTAELGQEKCANCHQTHIASSKECPAIRNAAAIQKLQRSGVGFEAAKHKVRKTQTELATKAPFTKKQNLTVPTVRSNIMGSQHSIQGNQQENQNDLTIQEVMVDIHQSGGSYLWSDAEALPSTASSSPLYISVVQTWLTDTAPKPNFVGYVATWCPRVAGVRGGGLAILVRLDIPLHHLRLEPFDGNLELQGVTLNTASGLIDIINVYNPNQPFSLSELRHYLQQLNHTFLYLRDFNAHSPLWDERSRTNPAGRALEEMLDTFPLGIINNDSPTYIDRGVGTTSTLDLFFATHNLARTSEVRTGPDLESDHFPVCCTLRVFPTRHAMGAAQHWKLGAADWRKWTSHLNAHTDQTHVGPCNAIMGNDFLLGAINSAAEKSVPMSTGRTGISRATPWWDATCSKVVAQHRRAKGQLFRSPSQENLVRYKRLEAVAKRTILLKKRNSFAQYVGALTCSTPSASVWQCIRSISRRASMPNYSVGGPHATALEKQRYFPSTSGDIVRPQLLREVTRAFGPTCLLSCIGKLMERMIQRRLEYWVDTNNLLLWEQAGFRRGKSTMNSLLIAKDFIANTFCRKQICVTVYLDLDGAYDSVWLEGIIYKLIASGLEKTYVKWLKNYLTRRTASVRLGAVQSEGVPITWGLPQGAVLSPLLFNIMLSDLPVADGVQLIIYADDITILSKGDTNRKSEQEPCPQCHLGVTSQISSQSMLHVEQHTMGKKQQMIMQEDLNAKYSGFTQIFTDGSELLSGSTAAALFVPSLAQARSSSLPTVDRNWAKTLMMRSCTLDEESPGQGIKTIVSVGDAVLSSCHSSVENVPLSQPVHIGREATPVAENDANELLHPHGPGEDG